MAGGRAALGLHWESLDEDLSVAGLLMGSRPAGVRGWLGPKSPCEAARQPRRDELVQAHRLPLRFFGEGTMQLGRHAQRERS